MSKKNKKHSMSRREKAAAMASLLTAARHLEDATGSERGTATELYSKVTRKSSLVMCPDDQDMLWVRRFDGNAINTFTKPNVSEENILTCVAEEEEWVGGAKYGRDVELKSYVIGLP